MSVVKEFLVTLEKVDYLGAGQQSADIGSDFKLIFVREDDKKQVIAEDLEHGKSESFNDYLLSGRLSPSQFPYYVDIRTVIAEKGDKVGNPVFTEDYVLNIDDTEVWHKVLVKVHEDDNFQSPPAVFIVHFKAVLRDIPGEPAEELPPVEDGGGVDPGGAGEQDPPSGSSGFSIEHPSAIGPGAPAETPVHLFLSNSHMADTHLLAFVSDTHIGLDKHSDDFDKADDASFVSMISVLSDLKVKSKELILLGDFLELWEPRPHFKNLAGYNERVAAAQTKISRIVHKHKAVFNAIADFSKANKVTYIYGNHDDEMQDLKVRQHFLKVTGIDASFSFEYENETFEVFAQHGHQFDKYNWTINPFGDPPVGRWIVENFVVPLEEIMAGNKSGPFGPIDSFDSQDDFIEYVRCLKKEGKIGQNTFDQVDDLIGRMNHDLELGGLDAVLKGFFNLIFGPVKSAKLKSEMDQFETAMEIMEFLGFGIGLEEDDYTGFLNGTNRSCILMGHTHEGYIRKVANSKLIINTGTWQDKHVRNRQNPCQPTPVYSRHITILINGKSEKDKKEDGRVYPAGSDIVQAMLCSEEPGGISTYEYGSYYLEP